MESSEGLRPLFDVISGRVTVLVGPSGVGKSTLINRIRQMSLALAEEACADAGCPSFTEEEIFAEQQVGHVSVKLGRGKHTTRTTSLLRVPCVKINHAQKKLLLLTVLALRFLRL